MTHRIFTLVELMIVVAIIQVLAAIAIPNFYMFQLKAKRTEAIVNASSISDAIGIYTADNEAQGWSGTYFPRDGTTVDKELSVWPAASAPIEYGQIGWGPDGSVRCGYQAMASGANAICDVDGDGQLFHLRWYPPNSDVAADYNARCFTPDDCDLDNTMCNCY